MNDRSSEVRACIESLETRRMLSHPANIVGEFLGTASGNNVFIVTLDVTTEDRHGLILGTIAIRFSKHNAPVYSFIGRIIGDSLSFDIPAHVTKLDAVVDTRHATIKGTGRSNGAGGVFSLKLVPGV